MLKSALDAFINADADLAKHLLPLDNTVDSLEREIIERLTELMEKDPSWIHPAVRLILVVRALERMSDHATNIAENVIFLIEARLIRHRQLEELSGSPPRQQP